MDRNNSRSGIKSRAVVLRCSDETYLELMQLIRSLPDCYIVFSKTSSLKLLIREEGW